MKFVNSGLIAQLVTPIAIGADSSNQKKNTSMHHVYILYSKKLKKFYIGNTDLLPQDRLQQHNSSYNAGSFTTKGIPWQMFLEIACQSRLQARQVELHIKKMKSRKYIHNLKKYSEMRQKLLARFESN